MVRYFGIGTFHQIPQQGGLKAAAILENGKETVGTDSSWLAFTSPGWLQWISKISIQMEPVESYAARQKKEPDWQNAIETRDITQTDRGRV